MAKKYMIRSSASLFIKFSSVTQSCPTLCDPTNRSTPDLPVHHQLPEFTKTHTRRVSDAIQPSHPLSSPSPPAPNPCQHQSFPMSQLFAGGGQSTGVSEFCQENALVIANTLFQKHKRRLYTRTSPDGQHQSN